MIIKNGTIECKVYIYGWRNLVGLSMEVCVYVWVGMKEFVLPIIHDLWIWTREREREKWMSWSEKKIVVKGIIFDLYNCGYQQKVLS